MQGHINRYQVLTNRAPLRRQALVEEHAATLDAFLARDPARAERTVRDHIGAARVQAMAALTGLAAAQQPG